MKESGTDWRGLRATIGGWYLVSPVRRLAETLFFGDLSATYLQEITRRIPFGDETVLDLGAGSGYFSLKIARNLPGGKVICVDLSREMLAILKKRARKKGLMKNIQILRSAAEGIDVEDEICDLAVSSCLFHELIRPEVGLAEMVRAVKPGGHVVVSDFRDIRMPHGPEVHGPFSVEQLNDLFEESGLTEIEVYPVKHHVVGVGKKYSDAA